MSLACGIALPSVGASLYFYSTADSRKALEANNGLKSDSQLDVLKVENGNSVSEPIFSCRGAFELLWIQLKSSYSNKVVIQWSFWWALAMCGFLQVKFASVQAMHRDGN